jgi:phosphatidate cytidylyltransferase
MNNLQKRIITSAVLIGIVLSCLFINNYTWLLLLIIVSLISLVEIINLSKKIWKNKLILFIFSTISFIYLFFFTVITFRAKAWLDVEGILFILSICILSDIGGYIVGKSIGGKKLTKISPNKTISGSIGSFLFSLLPLMFIDEIFVKVEFINIIWILTISLTCQLGDLFISYLKRLAKVKDTGSFLPGHGGILDRIDGIVFGVPASFLFWVMIVN